MRLFFALWPPIEAASQLAAIARSCASAFGGKPTRQETIHLTMAFLGDVPEEKLPLLLETAKRISVAPFMLNIDSLNYWHHNHLLWAGNTLPCVALGDLVGRLRNALAEGGFAVDDGKRFFTPHLSLVRKIPETGSPPVLPAIESISWLCSSFALVRSRLSEVGPVYETLGEFSLTPLGRH